MRKGVKRMGNEAAAMAQGAEQSGEIIHYAATEIAPGIVINMQTMYMTWIAMAIVFVLFFIVSRNPKMVPSGLQNVMDYYLVHVHLNKQRNRHASSDWCSLDVTDQRHQYMFCTFAVNRP